MPKSRSPLGLQMGLGAAAHALLWVQEQQCYSSCIALQQSSTVSFLSWPYFGVCMSLRPCSGLCVAILALYPHNNLIAFTIDFGGWLSSHLVLGYNRENIYLKIPFWNVLPFFKRTFFTVLCGFMFLEMLGCGKEWKKSILQICQCNKDPLYSRGRIMDSWNQSYTF